MVLVFEMTEKTIQSVPIMPFALMLACIGAVIGVAIGLFYALFFGTLFSLLPAASQTGVDRPLLQLIFGVGAIVVMPITGFVGGLIQGLLYAALYNFLAPKIGGIRVRFKEDNSPPP